MSTLSTLESDVEAGLVTLGHTVLGTGSRPEELVARSVTAVLVVIASTDFIVSGSNTTKQIADVDLTLIGRAAGSTLAQIKTAEDTLRDDMEALADPDWWTALTSVSQSERPEIEIGSVPDRVGECIVVELRASVMLEV
jgi:hypothetical protein